MDKLNNRPRKSLSYELQMKFLNEETYHAYCCFWHPFTEENPAYRKAADKCFKRIYRDDICDIFPRYGHPKIIEIWGDRLTRIKKLESYL
jgi:hypothetical protein